jgi:hypothetical protein
MFPNYGKKPVTPTVPPTSVNSSRETRDEFIEAAMKSGFSKSEAERLWDGQKATEPLSPPAPTYRR